MSLWILFINWRTQPVYDFYWLNHRKWFVLDPMRGSWILSKGEGWDCFLHPKILPKHNKVIVSCPESAKWLSILNELSGSKMSSLRIYISPVMEKLETLNLNSTVNLIQRVLLGTPPQKELASLPHIHVTLTNLFISRLRTTVVKFGQ